MSVEYVSDYEQVTGQNREVVTKVVAAPEVAVPVEPVTVAEVE